MMNSLRPRKLSLIVMVPASSRCPKRWDLTVHVYIQTVWYECNLTFFLSFFHWELFLSNVIFFLRSLILTCNTIFSCFTGTFCLTLSTNSVLIIRIILVFFFNRWISQVLYRWVVQNCIVGTLIRIWCS